MQPQSVLRLAVAFLLLAYGAPSALAQVELEVVPFGATWRYLDTGVDPGPSWAQPGFDDSTWSSGPAQFGYGEGDESTVVDFGSSPQDRHLTTWFRTTFELGDVEEWRSLRLFLLRDDGAAVWLNGELLRTDRMPWGGWDAETLADGTTEGSEEAILHGFDQSPDTLVQGTNVLAVEVHQAAPDSDDLSFDLSLTARRLHGIVRGPYLQPESPTSMRVRWSTARPTYSAVRFGTSPDLLDNQVSIQGQFTDHNVLVTGLQPETVYHYDLGPQAGELLPGREYRFRTPPEPTTTQHRFWVTGDAGTANQFQRAVRDGLTAAGGPDPDLWVLLGDNAYPQGDPAAYQRALFDMYPAQLSQTPLISVRGNHENDETYFYETFDFPADGAMGGVPSGSEAYFSMDWGNVHFVCLDSYATSRAVGDAMYTWLEADLAAFDAEWLIAVWHHPPYSAGTHNSDNVLNMVEMRANFLPLLEGAGVDLVLAGHSHGYERSFLIDGHYGQSGAFDSSMLVDGGDGQESGDGAYTTANTPGSGAVFSVTGCSGDVRPANYDHPVMFVSGPLLGSLLIDVSGPRLDYSFIGIEGQVQDSFTLLHDDSIQTYCAPTLHSGGCASTISWEGQPSLSGSQGFLIHADQMLPDANGLMIYGFEASDVPLFEGRLCVAQPLTRRPTVNSGGSTGCSGRLSDDFGALLAMGSDPLLQAGVTVYTQFWFRDSASSTGANFSEALSFVLLP